MDIPRNTDSSNRLLFLELTVRLVETPLGLYFGLTVPLFGLDAFPFLFHKLLLNKPLPY